MGVETSEARRLFDRMLWLPATVFVSGVELFAQAMQELAGDEVDDLLSRVTHTLNSDLKNQARSGARGRTERGGLSIEEGDIKMKEKDSKQETLKLVRYKVLFIKRDYEVAFPEREELVADDLSTTDFTAWKIAEFIQRLGEEEVPRQWRRKNYPRDFKGEQTPTIRHLPEEDKKYLRLYYEVLDTYERSKFHHPQKQIAVLEEIRDALRKRRDQNGDGDGEDQHKPGLITLPKTMCLAATINPRESEFGDEFFNFPDFLGQRPAPGGTKLTGWIEFQFSPPVGDKSKFTVNYFVVGTSDMIEWGHGARYRLLRNRAFQNPTPFNAQGKPDPTVKSGGTLNLRTGEVEGMEMHAIFQNTVIAAVDRLNRIPFGFPNDYPPPQLPPEVKLPFPDQPTIFVKARFKTEKGSITGFEFHGETIAPVTLFPFLGLFPPFSFGPDGAFYFANPTDCPEGASPKNCPTDETNPDGLHLPMPAFFHPHFYLVTSAVREVPPSGQAAPCLPGDGVTHGVAAAHGDHLYYMGGIENGTATARVHVFEQKNNRWADGPKMPTAVADAQCALIGKKIYVVGGRTSDGAPSRLLQSLDTVTGKWSILAPAPAAVAGAAVAAVEDKFYVAGGYTNREDEEASFTDRVQIYDPATNS
ncbi:MAG: hypothetical protein H0T60_08020, partial [Acidobacteria bacterium]|nr:hypothetical protein [Acidobacteriota bacterium]